MAKTLKELEKEISKVQKTIEKINKKEEKDGSLSYADAGTRNSYQKMLNELEAKKEKILNGGSSTVIPKKVDNTPAATAPKTVTPAAPVVNKPSTGSKEKRLENVEDKATETADEMNSEEAKNNKIEDAKSAAETAKDRAAQVDANVEENIPTWFWREAQEMSPSDKAKRGFIISNYILNRLGTAAGNIGAIIQNAGGSGGASLKEHGGSYIDQYRKSKLEQAMANRKTRQNNLLQQQIDALVAIGASENEARAIQNKLRNSKYWNKYNRLTNEQQVYIQGLLYSDTKGEITDAVLGDFIDRIMKGKDVSLNNVAATALTAAGIDNVDKLTSVAGTIGEKVTNWLAGAAGWKKPGE
jgi:predicted  nucleic acid-binding Zn-ribbon protein